MASWFRNWSSAWGGTSTGALGSPAKVSSRVVSQSVTLSSAGVGGNDKRGGSWKATKNVLGFWGAEGWAILENGRYRGRGGGNLQGADRATNRRISILTTGDSNGDRESRRGRGWVVVRMRAIKFPGAEQKIGTNQSIRVRGLRSLFSPNSGDHSLP